MANYHQGESLFQDRKSSSHDQFDRDQSARCVELGLVDNGPEPVYSKKELLAAISSEARHMLDLLVNSPEEIYQVMGGCKGKQTGEMEFTRVSVILVRRYIRRQFSCSLQKANKILKEVVTYASEAAAVDNVYFKNN